MTQIKVETLVSKTGTPHTEESKTKIGNSNRTAKNKAVNKHTYIIQDPQGNMFVLAHSFTKFCKDNELSRHNLRKVAEGSRSHHKFWKASFYKEV